jgi:hypothetical protein
VVNLLHYQKCLSARPTPTPEKMKDTALDSVGAPAGINVEEGGGGKIATLASPESSLLAPKILPTPSAIHCLKSEDV